MQSQAIYAFKLVSVESRGAQYFDCCVGRSHVRPSDVPPRTSPPYTWVCLLFYYTAVTTESRNWMVRSEHLVCFIGYHVASVPQVCEPLLGSLDRCTCEAVVFLYPHLSVALGLIFATFGFCCQAFPGRCVLLCTSACWCG